MAITHCGRLAADRELNRAAEAGTLVRFSVAHDAPWLFTVITSTRSRRRSWMPCRTYSTRCALKAQSILTPSLPRPGAYEAGAVGPWIEPSNSVVVSFTYIVVGTALSFLAAAASFHLEGHFLNLKDRFAPPL